MKQTKEIETRGSEDTSQQVAKSDVNEFANPPLELLEFIEENWNDSEVTGNFMLAWMKKCNVVHQTAVLHITFKLLERGKLANWKMAYISCSFAGAAASKQYREGLNRGYEIGGAQ